MIKKILFSALTYVCIIGGVGAQEVPLNTQLLSHVAFSENSSGMWGYVDKNGLKYAVIGTASATRVFSLENPANPIERFVGPGAVGIWREVRYYKNYIYVSTDQGSDGLVIIDMNNAPENITYSFYKPELTVGTTVKNLARCHNIFIDEKGYCYLSGCNISNRGVLVFDLNQDPLNPPFVGYIDQRYSHDAYVRNDTMYNSEILDGLLSIYDVKKKDSIRLLTSFNTGRNFTHNAWTSDDSKYVFTTDERADAFVESYDISDFNNIRLLDRWKPLHSEGSGVIPHNTYYHRGYLITSYYTDGVRIIDAHRPDNLVEVAYFDTWNDPLRCHNDFYGCWGVYPLEDTDLVYASDINNGLYIIKVDFKRACYLEGRVQDANGAAVGNAKIEILSDQLNRGLSDPSGNYKTGLVHDGSFVVRISHPDYIPVEQTVQLVRGVVTELNVTLTKRFVKKTKFDIRDSSGQPVVAKIRLDGADKTYEFFTGQDGTAQQDVLTGNYRLHISGWGIKSQHSDAFIVESSGSGDFRFDLAPSYEDNFESDLGWTLLNGQDVRGSWVRVKPRGTYYLQGEKANADSDSDDAGTFAYVTGNGINGAACDDVDNNFTRITSPFMDLTKYNNPVLNYDVYFFNKGGNSPINDTMFVILGNGTDEVVIDKVYGHTDGWRQIRNRQIKSLLPVTNSMYLVVEASDQTGSTAHIVEAGFDHFFVSEGTTSTEENSTAEWELYPNPTNNDVYLRLEDKMLPTYYKIADITGRPMKSGILADRFATIDLGNCPPGVYFMQMGGKARKFIKL